MHFSPACFPLCEVGAVPAVPFQGCWVEVKGGPSTAQPGPPAGTPESGHTGALGCARPGAGPHWALRGLPARAGRSPTLRKRKRSSASPSDSREINPSAPRWGRLFGWRPGHSASPLRAPRRSHPCCARRLAGSGPRGLWTARREDAPGPATLADPDQLEGPKAPTSNLPPWWA